MVPKYEIMATPTNADTVLYPGSQATYHFSVHNLGYEPITVIISPSHEYFNNFHFYLEGNACTSFQMEPNEVKQITAEATLLPSIAPGTTCWLDILLALDCDCATALTTLWVTVIEPLGVEEQQAAITLFPNPAKGPVTIEGIGQLTVTNTLGQTVLTRYLDGKETLGLPKGIYVVRIENCNSVETKQLIVE